MGFSGKFAQESQTLSSFYSKSATMSNKRVLSASPDADTALDLQHMKKMPRKDILRGKLRDPVHNLNGDILNLIFDRLPIVDIVSCVFLSKAWKSAVLIWMHQSSKLAGQKLRRLCYETVPATVWQGMPIAEIKYHGRYSMPTPAFL